MAEIAIIVGLVTAVIAFPFGIFRPHWRYSKRFLVTLCSVGMLWSMLFIGGLIWINSPLCKDINICDSGGMLAFAADMTVLLAVAVIVAVPSAALASLWKR